MTLLHRLRGLVQPSWRDAPGDWSEDDAFLDAAAWTEETRGYGPLELARPSVIALAGMPPPVVGGRIQWRTILGTMPNVVWEAGWERRGAPVMNPTGILWHWTAGKPTATRPAPSLAICINGRPDVPGPLVPGLIGLDGRLHIICSGRANHAGPGHQALLADIRAGRMPRGSAAKLGLADTGGSGGALIGIEIENDGKAPLTEAQLVTIGQLGARCAKSFRWTRAQAGGYSHLNWTKRKIDVDPVKASQIFAAVSTS